MENICLSYLERKIIFKQPNYKTSLSSFERIKKRKVNNKIYNILGDSKLAVSVNVSISGCLFLCVRPVMSW